MIQLSKLRDSDTRILVIDVRPKQICIDRGTEPKVYLGYIDPRDEERDLWNWMSAWGHNCGEAKSLEAAQLAIEMCAQGMYE